MPRRRLPRPGLGQLTVPARPGAVSAAIVLPQLAVVAWPEPSDIDDQGAHDGLHWKTRALVDWAAGRPFVWVDDEVTDTDRSWVAAHHHGHALLHRVDPPSVSSRWWPHAAAWTQPTDRLRDHYITYGATDGWV